MMIIIRYHQISSWIIMNHHEPSQNRDQQGLDDVLEALEAEERRKWFRSFFRIYFGIFSQVYLVYFFIGFQTH